MNTSMKEKPLFPLLLSLTIPMMLSMLVNSLYNIVDSYFVARISENAMTALSLVYPMQNIVSALGIGFGVGINSAVAFYLGAQKKKQADEAASYGLFLSLIHGIIMMIVCTNIMPAFLGLYTNDAALIDLSLRYSNIVFMFSIAVTLTIGMEKVYQAEGRMNVTVVGLALGFILNMILDPLMIFGIGPFPAMGIEGAALATGIGQVSTLVFYIAVYFVKKSALDIRIKNIRPSRQLTLRLYGVGIPSTLNLALPSLLISMLNRILSVYSPSYILVLGIYYKLQSFLYLPSGGIIQGMRPLMAYNQGAGEYERVRNIFKIVLAMIAVYMLAGTLLFFFGAETLMSLFTMNSETIELGAAALRIISIGFIISSVSVTVSGALEALSHGGSSLVISVCRYVAVILPLAFVLSKFMGATGVWHAFYLTEFISAAVSFALYRKYICVPSTKTELVEQHA